MADDVFGIVGTLIGGAYQVERVVAEGGFGVVYRAHHGGFRAPVALKCLKIPTQLGSDDQVRFLEQFRAEAELLFRLSAGIATVVRPLAVDAFTASDDRFVPYMVLEWLEGETLDGLIKQRNAEGLPPFSLDEIVRLLGPAARALERAHNFSGPEGKVSIVHRDLKPENIFVAQVAGEETVKILDFGIGKAKSVASQVAGRASQDVAAMMLFTPAYGAPEQWVPKRFGQTGPWTDVWGLALTLVEATSGKPVMSGDPSAMMGTALDAVRRPTPRSEGVTVSDAVETVFAKALAVDPRERYPDCGAFWNALVEAMKAPNVAARGSALIAVRPSLGPSGQSSLRSIPASKSPAGEPTSGTLGKLLDRDAQMPLLGRVLPGAILIGVAVLLTIADQAYAALTGEVFELGPLRASLIGGLLLLAGIALIAYKLLPSRE